MNDVNRGDQQLEVEKSTCVGICGDGGSTGVSRKKKRNGGLWQVRLAPLSGARVRCMRRRARRAERGECEKGSEHGWAVCADDERRVPGPPIRSALWTPSTRERMCSPPRVSSGNGRERLEDPESEKGMALLQGKTEYLVKWKGWGSRSVCVHYMPYIDFHCPFAIFRPFPFEMSS